MIETYAEATENIIKEEMQKKLSDMITKNEKLKEKNEYLQKEVEDAKAVGERRGIHIIRAGAVYPHPAGNQWN